MLTPLVYIYSTRKVCLRLHEPLHTTGVHHIPTRDIHFCYVPGLQF